MTIRFIVSGIALGVGLAMDAFSVSLANGLHDPDMKKSQMARIAGTFGFFQFMMPMVGWTLVHTLIALFSPLSHLVPVIALLLLGYLGVKMIREGLEDREEEDAEVLGSGTLLLQGVATSIDALSAGLTIAEQGLAEAFGTCLLIAVTTFVNCIAGLFIGRRFGTRLAEKASILGGVILILIGLEIFVTHILGL